MMKFISYVYLSFMLWLVRLPYLLFRSRINYLNLLILSFKGRLKTRGVVALSDVSFSFEPESVKSYQRFLKVVTKEPDTNTWIDTFDVNDVFWDIGANVGVFSFYSSCKGIKTFSFEPDPLNYKELVKMIMLNRIKNINPLLIGVSSEPMLYSKLEFEDDGMESGRSMRSISFSESENKNCIGTITMSLGSVVDLLGIDFPNHIKIDVDGNELSIIENQQSFLSRPELKTILIEIDESDTASRNRIFDIFKDCNFTLFKRVPTYINSKFINHIFTK